MSEHYVDLCEVHENVQAIGRCIICGKLMCPLCVPDEGAQDVCRSCREDRTLDTEAPPPAWIVPRRHPLGIVLLGVLEILSAIATVGSGLTEPLTLFGITFPSISAAVLRVVFAGLAVYTGVGFFQGWSGAFVVFFITAGLSIAHLLGLLAQDAGAAELAQNLGMAVEQVTQLLVIVIVVQLATMVYVWTRRDYFGFKKRKSGS